MKTKLLAAAAAVAVAVGLFPVMVLGAPPGCVRHPQDPRCQTTTTTTLPPTTTTTTIPPLVIPATIPYPSGLDAGEGYRLQFACIDTAEVTCERNNGSLVYSDFDYHGHGMPYLYSESQPGNHDHAWWVDGDREGYQCGYGFMYDKHPNPFGHPEINRPESHFIARVSIVRADAYGKVNDKYMEEAVRFYDGTVNTVPGNELVAEDCLAAAIEPGFDYDAYQPHGEDQIRVGLFRADGEIGDIRDLTTNNPFGGHFEFVSFDGARVQVVFVADVTGKPSHALYYDVMNDGRIAVEVNGVTLLGG